MPIWKDLFKGSRSGDSDELGDVDPEYDQAMARLSAGLAQPPHESGVVGGGDINVGIAAIHARDPHFRARDFLDDVESVYLRFQQHWQQRSMESAMNGINPPFEAAFTALITRWVASGQPIIFDSPEPPSIRLENVLCDNNYDQIDVHIAAPATAGLAFGEFRNRWTFMRYHVAAVGGRELQQAICPRCGAPYSADPSNHCTYCGAAFSSTVFNWLLNGLRDITLGDDDAYPAAPQ